MSKLLYIEELEEVFTDIQTRRILEDQKTLVDCIPKCSLKKIVASYRENKIKPGFQLAAFFADYFELPEETMVLMNKKFSNTEAYINGLWDILTKEPHQSQHFETLISLPEKYIVPGGRFREVFYWDSYFTMLGLQAAKRIDLLESMVNNFAYLIDTFGFIPNGNRTYFLSRSQPPFFSMMVELLAEEKGDVVYENYLTQLEKEYAFWMRDAELLSVGLPASRHAVRMPGGEILNRYWDELNAPRPEGYIEDLETAKQAGKNNPEVYRHLRAGAESGWDFSSRWLKDGKNLSTIHTSDFVTLDLNCLLLHLEKSLVKTYEFIKDELAALRFTKLYQQREAAIQKYLWNEPQKIFTDYDCLKHTSSNQATLIMVYALASKLATQKQAYSIIDTLTANFLKQGGLVTTMINSGQQWDAPNGWAPLQWMAFKGALNYGFDAVADTIKNNWINNVDTVFKQTGMLTEKYNVVDICRFAGGGEYPNQYGFGWTNGVYLKLKSY